jgi:hypothetical protein
MTPEILLHSSTTLVASRAQTTIPTMIPDATKESNSKASPMDATAPRSVRVRAEALLKTEFYVPRLS